MNGTNPAIMNQSRNELPLILPMIPPAMPKQTMITIRPEPATPGSSPKDRLQRPQHRDRHRDHDDRPDDRLDHADHDPDPQRHRGHEDQPGEGASEDRRPGRLPLELCTHTRSVPRHRRAVYGVMPIRRRA